MARRYTDRPRWEIIARIVAAVILLLLIAYGVAWWFGFLRPDPGPLDAPAGRVYAPAAEPPPGD